MADTKPVKSAGEHWVCSVLSRMGWGAALTRDGLERTDILAVDPVAEPRHLVEIQVKTTTGTNPKTGNWLLGLKAQQPARSENEWFVLVSLDLKTADRPRSFVMPRDHVGAAAVLRHTEWLTEPGVPVGQRNTPVEQARVQIGVVEGYEDRWDLLALPTSDAPVLLPKRYRALAQSGEVAFPSGHPWWENLPVW